LPALRARAAPFAHTAQAFEPEAQVLVNVLSEQIRERYINLDPHKHKLLLFNDAVLKQIVLFPNGRSLMKKLGAIAGISDSETDDAFAKGMNLVSALCRRLKGPTLRDLGLLSLQPVSAPASARPHSARCAHSP
jgi:hypothetical protein